MTDNADDMPVVDFVVPPCIMILYDRLKLQTGAAIPVDPTNFLPQVSPIGQIALMLLCIETASR